MTDVIIGKQGGHYLTAKGQQFVLLAAPTGGEKGTAVVLPNLLNFDGSTVVFDLKLENYRLTSKFRERHGQKVFLFAPFTEDGHTHRWNTLDTISRDPLKRVGDTLAVGQVFFPSDCDPREKFWNDNARNLFLGLVLFLMDTPSLPCTLGEILRQSSGKGKPLKDHIQALIAARADADCPLSDDCLDALARFLSSPENTLGNILSTFNAPLLIFANPVVDAATSATDFDIGELRSKRTTIYVGVQPSRLSDAALLVNMLFSRIIELNTKELPENNPDLKYQCLLILDEFTAMGKVGAIAKANSFIRGYNLRLLTVIQSIAQLESVYGAAETRTLVTNHAIQILYPPGEQKDANEYSEMLGYFTEKVVSTGISRPRSWGQAGSSSENTSAQRRALMLPQELKEMPRHQQIVMVKHCKPVLCQKARYYEDSRLIDRLKEVSPALASLDRHGLRGLLTKLGLGSFCKKLPTEAQIKHAAFVLQELSSVVPLIDVELHRAKVEQRVRPIAVGEAIDLSKLVFNLDGLPQFDGPVPSPESVSAVVESFFAGLEWEDDDTSGKEIIPDDASSGEAPHSKARANAPEATINTNATSLGGSASPRLTAVTPGAGDIDLSKLDQT